MDNCKCPFPSEKDACQAASCLHEMACGNCDWDPQCFAHCGWVIQGAALSKAIDPGPCPCPGPCPEPNPDAKKEIILRTDPFHQAATGKKLTLDWGTLLRDLLQVINDLLGGGGRLRKP